MKDISGKGYFISTADNSDFYIENAWHVQRDDVMDKYPDDTAATEAAKKDGVTFITGIRGIPDGVYLDTEENRNYLERWAYDRLYCHPSRTAAKWASLYPDEYLLLYQVSDDTRGPKRYTAYSRHDSKETAEEVKRLVHGVDLYFKYGDNVRYKHIKA